ncbi:MAG TPA: bifunctional nuclease family protein [Acidimicrobiales bacterium]
MRPVDVLGLNVEAASGGPLVLLREHDAPYRVLPMAIGTPEAIAIGLALGHEVPPRPLTHDLLATLIHDLHAQVDHVEVTELREGTFHAELTLRGPTGVRRLDSRPSDAIALALRVDAPVYVSEEVLDEAGAILQVVSEDDLADDDLAAEDEAVDEEVIEAEVARFRALLDDIDPARLADIGDIADAVRDADVEAPAPAAGTAEAGEGEVDAVDDDEDDDIDDGIRTVDDLDDLDAAGDEDPDDVGDAGDEDDGPGGPTRP